MIQKQGLVNMYTIPTNNGELPKVFKRAKFAAILNPGKDRDLAEIFRPIALLCTLP